MDLRLCGCEADMAKLSMLSHQLQLLPLSPDRLAAQDLRNPEKAYSMSKPERFAQGIGDTFLISVALENRDIKTFEVSVPLVKLHSLQPLLAFNDPCGVEALARVSHGYEVAGFPCHCHARPAKEV